MLTPLLRMDFQALAQSQYVVPQFLKPRQAHFGDRDEWNFETSQRMHETLASMKISHAGHQLVGGAGSRANLLGGIFDVAAIAVAPDRSFAVFSGKPTQKTAGLSDLADLAQAEILSGIEMGGLESIMAWEQALWRWDGVTGGIVPLAKFGRVATIDIAPSGTWAAVIEDIPGPYDTYVSRVSMPSGRREWSVPIDSWVLPHLRISPDERWIAVGGPSLMDARTGCQRLPIEPWGTGADGTRGAAFPHWHPRRPDRLLCLGSRSDLDRALLCYEIDLGSGDIVEEAELRGPVEDENAQGPRVLGCDVDASGTYALVVSDLGVTSDAIDDTGGGALSCLNLITGSVEWTQPVIDGAFVRVLNSPRWIPAALPPANSEPVLASWQSLEAQLVTDHDSKRLLEQRSNGFDEEFLHRGAVAVNRMLRADSDGEVQFATYFALLDLDAARALGQIDQMGDQLRAVLTPMADGSDADRSDEQRRAARQLLAVIAEPQTEAFWQTVLHE